ncbi:50S ribosomal protein L23 [Patescibacteria group bacterium]|nr:50S ribosomal protein L23 [Patescibacteria group bacterium]
MRTDIIKNGRITEKASFAAEQNVYVFNVTDKANKTEIKKAIFALYKVKPIKVNVLAIPKKNTSLRGKPGTRGGGRKAVVYLKEGDKIELV